MRTKEKEKENGRETRTRSYALAGIVAIAVALIAAMMVIPAAAFEPGECDIYVHNGQSIDAAVNSATDGQTVCVYNGTYGGRIDFEGDPNITLKGEGADVVTWDGGSEDKIVIGDNDVATYGTILEGFTIKGTQACMDLVRPLAPDCIIRNCVFESSGGGTTNIAIAAHNTTFENNVVTGFVNGNCLYVYDSVNIANNSFINNPFATTTKSAIYIKGPNCTVSNNTITNNNGRGIGLSSTSSNGTITKNNISSNYVGFKIFTAEGHKIYLNNICDNTAGSVEYGATPPTTIYWNSTEQITYTYNPTFTNYLGNYWGSDYTGTDADGDGIGDTPYPIPGSPTDMDYRPLMEPFENYPAPGPTPTPTPTPGPAPTGVPEFNAMGLVALIGVLSAVLVVTTVGSKRKRE